MFSCRAFPSTALTILHFFSLCVVDISTFFALLSASLTCITRSLVMSPSASINIEKASPLRRQPPRCMARLVPLSGPLVTAAIKLKQRFSFAMKILSVRCELVHLRRVGPGLLSRRCQLAPFLASETEDVVLGPHLEVIQRGTVLVATGIVTEVETKLTDHYQGAGGNWVLLVLQVLMRSPWASPREFESFQQIIRVIQPNVSLRGAGNPSYHRHHLPLFKPNFNSQLPHVYGLRGRCF
mmetsp:Transcript_55848/g.76227  ORF Transcript_55848/g.76227 Transcript_55848/m.76227 type:complete len:239 (-) Transcript_55848:380-1096(-)